MLGGIYPICCRTLRAARGDFVGLRSRWRHIIDLHAELRRYFRLAMRDFAGVLELACKLKDSVKNKFKGFTDYKYASYILAAALCLVVSLTVSLVLGMYPFGDRSILTVDLYHQYAPFLQELQRKLRSFEDLFFTWNVGLGINYLAIAAYYVLSPFNLLLFILPAKLLPFNVWLIINLKLLAITLATVGFLRYYYERRRTVLWRKLKSQLAFCTDYAAQVEYGENRRLRRRLHLTAQVFLPVFFAWSGYVCAYLWNLMWLDGLLALPLMAWGIAKIVRERKPWLYVLALAYTITCNYYTAIFNCLFAALYSLTVIFDEWQQRRSELQLAKKYCLYTAQDEEERTLWRSLIEKATLGPKVIHSLLDFTVLSLLGALLSSQLILPVLSAFGTSSASGDKFPTSHAFRHSLMELLERLLAFGKGNVRDGGPNIYLGFFALVCLALLLYRLYTKPVGLVSKFLLAAFIVVGFSSNVLNFIWHGMHYPNQIPHRFAYLFIFIALQIVCELWVSIRRSDALYLFIGAIWSTVCIALFYLYGTVQEMPQYQLLGNFCLAVAYTLVTAVLFYAWQHPGKTEKRLRKLKAVILREQAALTARGAEFATISELESVAVTPVQELLPDVGQLSDETAPVDAGQAAEEGRYVEVPVTGVPFAAGTTVTGTQPLADTSFVVSAKQLEDTSLIAGTQPVGETCSAAVAPCVVATESCAVTGEPCVVAAVASEAVAAVPHEDTEVINCEEHAWDEQGEIMQTPALDFLKKDFKALEKKYLHLRLRQKSLFKLGAYLLIILLAAEVALNASVQMLNLHSNEYLTSMSGYINKLESKSIAAEAIKELEQDHMYHVESMPPKTIDDGALYGFYGVTAFSSTSNKFTSETMRRLGLHGNNINSYKVNMPLEMFSNLMGLKYFITEQAADVEAAKKQTAYLNWRKLDNATLNIPDDTLIWQNQEALGIAFLAKNSVFDFKINHTVPYNVYNEFTAVSLGYEDYSADFAATYEGGKQALYTAFTPQLKEQFNNTFELDNNHYVFKAVEVQNEAEATVKEHKVVLQYLAQDEIENLSLFANGKGKVTVSFKVLDAAMEPIKEDSPDRQVTLLQQLSVGYPEAVQAPLLKQGQTLEITLILGSKDDDMNIYFAKQNEEVKARLLTFLQSREVDMHRVKNTRLEARLSEDFTGFADAAVNVSAENGGESQAAVSDGLPADTALAEYEVLALTVPFDKGWTLEVDGQVAQRRSWLNIKEHSENLSAEEIVKSEQNKGAFLAFVLPSPLKPDSVLKLTYCPEHYKLGLLLTLAGVILSIAYAAYLAQARGEEFGGITLWRKLNSCLKSRIGK